tara:strand:+ start:1211 stop:1315 length:105 start_codon:yes stop_codon:yes gene_type:complete
MGFMRVPFMILKALDVLSDLFILWALMTGLWQTK